MFAKSHYFAAVRHYNVYVKTFFLQPFTINIGLALLLKLKDNCLTILNESAINLIFH